MSLFCRKSAGETSATRPTSFNGIHSALWFSDGERNVKCREGEVLQGKNEHNRYFYENTSKPSMSCNRETKH